MRPDESSLGSWRDLPPPGGGRRAPGSGGGGADRPRKALVVIPTYNERENLAELVPRILAVDPRFEVLVVDDASPDRTGELADEIAARTPRLHVMHRPGKLGLGSAYRAGFRYALERDYDVVMEMDADFSHDPASLPDFLRAIEDADLVIGSRYLNGVTVVNWPMDRLLLSYAANRYTHFVTGLPLRDATAGFKCFRRRVLEAIDLDHVRSDGYSFQIEMSFKAWKRGFRLREIPIVFSDRRVGVSKMSKRIVREAAVMVWRLRLWDLIGRL
jgi:dolichol-phosphate mannosyltransferase